MSHRRPLSFKEREKDLLDFFDNNGGSEIVKVALKFYIDNKDKIISDKLLNELKSLIGQSSNVKNEVKSVINQKAFNLLK